MVTMTDSSSSPHLFPFGDSEENTILPALPDGGELILYQTENGETKIEVRLEAETVWLTQSQMAELFQTDQSGIARHIKNVFKSGELEEESTMQKVRIRNSDKPVQTYSLDVIISVGYRVSSYRATKFRIWATKRLKEHILSYKYPPQQILAEMFGNDNHALRQAKQDKKGYVYLIQSPTGYCKIGRTKNPEDRLSTFKVKLPFEVEYLYLI